MNLPKASIVGMLLYSHDLDSIVSKLLNAREDIISKVRIRIYHRFLQLTLVEKHKVQGRM